MQNEYRGMHTNYIDLIYVNIRPQTAKTRGVNTKNYNRDFFSGTSLSSLPHIRDIAQWAKSRKTPTKILKFV